MRMSTLETTTETTGTNGHLDAAGIAVENPATGETIAHVPEMGADEVREVVERARAAQPAWNALGFAGRARVMRNTRRWLIENRERMINTIVAETGKTPEDAQLTEVFFIADSLGFWAKNAEKYLADERIRTHSPTLLGRKLVKRYKPRGVIGIIGPWNYPMGLPFGDTIPALMAGNTTVVKPSEVTPLSMLLMAEGFRAAGAPDDVMLIATGRGETGAALIDHVDMVAFTGSTATGKKVAARAAERLIPTTLELGGKDPMIVLSDADLERAANTAVYWGMSNGGQICQAVERIYVEEPVYDDFVAKVVEKAGALRQGPPGEPGSVDIGAVTFPPQIELIERHVNDAVDKGATVLVGGKRREGTGRFFEPTVLVDVDHTMSIMRDETFGPALPIMKVRDVEHALELANDTRYGLNSSVWTKDVEKGRRVAERIEAGSACVNDAVINYGAQELPFGGVKESGIGTRHSGSGIQKYCNTQALLITRFGMKREMYYFPYSKRGTKMLERLLVLMYGRK
jgi:acyl-CoA reductase-like NAD-dependent aldehyde dehydrogenase